MLIHIGEFFNECTHKALIKTSIFLQFSVEGLPRGMNPSSKYKGSINYLP